MAYELETGDAISLLDARVAGEIHCVVCSPPYYGLRDYAHDPTVWPGGEVVSLGQEETPEEYIAHLVQIFESVKRALHDEGTVWLNIGDSYYHGKKHPSFKAKDIMMMPHRVAIALQENGWIVRQDIVWQKQNAMPEPVKDRPTLSHEYIFLLAKSPSYFYDQRAIREEWTDKSDSAVNRAIFGHKKYHGKAETAGEGQRGRFGEAKVAGDPRDGRNKRSVWTMPRQSYPGAHFAVYPTWLIEPCIKAGSSERGACPSCGNQWRRVDKHEWAAGCECGEDPVPAIVLDPFSGSATTGVVALLNGRDYLGLDCQPEYNELGRNRLETEVMPIIRHKAPAMDRFFE